ncbi:MAG: beta-propeller fold lactonase family protein, partial [Pseudonocardiales bacterium]|nr:beta-propeller fold lactonase family protein [Pseudonocardiales bacterium]
MGLSELTIHPTPRSRRVHAVFTGSSSSVGHGGPGRPRNVRCCVGAGWLPPSGRGSRGLPSPRPGGDSVSGRLWAVAYLCVLVLLASGCGAAAPGRSGRDGGGPGPLPVGYQLSPAGTQHPLGDLPLASALSPDGRWLAVSNDGQGVQSLQLVSTVDGSVAQTVSYPEPNGLFVGLVFSSDGQMLFASAGGGNIIRRYAVHAGVLAELPPLALPTVNPAGTKINPFPAGIALTPDGQRLLVADEQADAVTVIDLASGATHTGAAGHHPFSITSGADGRTAYVTNLGADTVSVIDLTGPRPSEAKTIAVGTHPNKAIGSRDRRTLYVAAGDADQVSVVDTSSNTVTRTISVAPYPGAPVGSNPDDLALAPDGSVLYVANAGNNDVAVVDLASGRVDGLIPTGWYPTSVEVAANTLSANTLFVTNGKGIGAGPNNGLGHPDPYNPAGTRPDQYSGSMMVGTLSMVPLPIDAAQLANWTSQVGRNDGFDNAGRVHAAPGATSVIPRNPDEHSPIQHVIYVVKENRTYDQVFGSLGKGNGDPTLDLFEDESAPNARALERQFVTFDNFYADAEVSAQGWNWTVAANSNPYSEQLWVSNYSHRGAPYPSESGDPATAPNRDPSQAYIWDRLAAAHVTFRNYGFYIDLDAPSNEARPHDPVLDAATDHNFRRFDLHCPDAANTFTSGPDCGQPRVAEWKTEFDQFVAHQNLPTVELVRLPSDHNAGARPAAPTPRAYIADNDWALGQLVDAVSHSPYWPSTAIFVTEDDAQDAPDHVDAHRTIAEVISPYTHTGSVDSTFYSTASMLRTIELIVGLRPLTQFDAYATPMLAAFTNTPDPAAYTALKPTQNMNETNPRPLGAPADDEDLSHEDRINMARFN